MNINRRRFLKLTGSVLAALAIALPESQTARKFDPDKIYYNWVTISDWQQVSIGEAKRVLTEQIRLAIPPEYCSKKYIKFIYHEPGACGTGYLDEESFVGSVGWKYIPERKIA